jgi:acyl-CoA synthetase
VLQFYGSNEVGAVSRTTLDDPQDERLSTAGRVIPAMNVRLFDESGADVSARGRGQPGCKGPTLSGGYWGDDEATAGLFTPDGWMLLGDVVEIDDAGYLCVIGRTDDFIIRGGKNISAAAVEEQVCAHPAVSLAAAVAAPDPVFGEKVCVYVELAGSEGLSLERLVESLLARGCSTETLPEYLVVMDELPRSSGGKIAKQSLRDDVKGRFSNG